MTMLGDYFIAGDVDTEIIKPLKGVSLCREELERILPDDMGKVILNLRRDDLIDIMLDGGKQKPAVLGQKAGRQT